MNRLTVLIKPASGECMLDCTYCFYKQLRKKRGMMDEKTVDALFDMLSDYTYITFAFQGGEPLLAGADFYASFCEKAEKRGIRADYSLQTNGMLVDEGFCELFKKYGFLIGLSVDGTSSVHNKNRKTPSGDGTYSGAMEAVKLLRRYNVEFDILTVVTSDICRHAVGVYNDYKKRGFEFVQLIPCLQPLYGDRSHCPEPLRLAEFLCDFFDLWYNDVSSGAAVFNVREFSDIFSILDGKRVGCTYNGACVPQLIVESDGDIYPCDFYVTDRYKTGSVFSSTPAQTLQSPGMALFKSETAENTEHCLDCPVAVVCRGFCRRMRTLFVKYDVCPWRQLIQHIIKRRG